MERDRDKMEAQWPTPGLSDRGSVLMTVETSIDDGGGGAPSGDALPHASVSILGVNRDGRAEWNVPDGR